MTGQMSFDDLPPLTDDTTSPPEWARLTDDDITRGLGHVARLRLEAEQRAAARASAGREAPHPRHTPPPVVDPADEQF